MVEKLGAAFERGLQDPTVKSILDSRCMRNIYVGPGAADGARARQEQMFRDMLAAIK